MMELLTCHFTDGLMDGLEKIVRDKLYPSRAEAVRTAVRDLLRKEGYWPPKNSED